MSSRIIKRALLSVYDKTGLYELGLVLAELGVEIIATGSTAALLERAGVLVTRVEDYTGSPEMLDGRLKTLHPRIHGGLLAVRGLHDDDMATHDIKPIDLVVVNLYPFEQTVASGAESGETIEKIDVGGPSMIRAAAKNFADVCVLTSTDDYGLVYSGSTTLELRHKMAFKAFSLVSRYDKVIANWLGGSELHQTIDFNGEVYNKSIDFRYGENPHQKAYFCGNLGFEQIQGKTLSYNNLLDVDAAVRVIGEFTDPVVAIIKHNSPCGVADGLNLTEAYKRAFSCDPISSFGGIIAVNGVVDANLAQELVKTFIEVIIAEGFLEEAKKILESKPNLRVLVCARRPIKLERKMDVHSVLSGFVVQEHNESSHYEQKFVTSIRPSDEAMNDLDFAWRICKHVRSNAIVVAQGGRAIGIGGGQTSRIASMKIALEASKEHSGRKVLASDAFFPFPDSIELAAHYGIEAIIQPGGSIRDSEVIKFAEEFGIAMIFTGMRNFCH